MEGFGGSGFTGGNTMVKKKRSTMLRRPRTDTSPPTTPSSDNTSKLSPNDKAGYDVSNKKREFSLNTSAPMPSSLDKTEGHSTKRKARKEDRKYGNIDSFYAPGSSRSSQDGFSSKRCSGLTLANVKSAVKFKEHSKVQSASVDGYVGKGSGDHHMSQLKGGLKESVENKSRKVKLKVGGVNRTMNAKLENDNGDPAKASRSSNASRHRQKLVLQDSSADEHTPAERSPRVEQPDNPNSISLSESVRKSRRMPKRRVFDGDRGDDDSQYLKSLKSSRGNTDLKVQHDDNKDLVKKNKVSILSKSKKTGYDVDEDYGSSQPTRDSRKRPRTARESDDTDFVEEEEVASDDGSHANKMPQKVDPSADSKMEPLTTRQRSSKGAGGPLIEFPDGLPPAPSRRQKEKLSEVEQQAKKAEAAQRRRLQVEKQAKELEAEAIRKILGQDSSRKKKEDKERKEREEKAQRKAEEALVLAPGSTRWIMGPTGTVVTFADDIGLPSIFAGPRSYPPPREKCVGPSCTNAYKYRDSKLNLPLCSLQCYRAVQGNSPPVSTCRRFSY